MIYYGPKQRGRRKTLMTAVSFSLRLADLGAEEKNVPTHTSTRTHTYTYTIYIYIFIHRSSWENVQRFLFLYTYIIYMMRVYVYRKHIYKKYSDNFQLLRDNRVILYGVYRNCGVRIVGKITLSEPGVGGGVDGSGGGMAKKREKKVQCSTRIISRLEFFRPVGLTVRVLHLPRAAVAHALAPA